MLNICKKKGAAKKSKNKKKGSPKGTALKKNLFEPEIEPTTS